MHAHIIAAAGPDSGWRYATETWSTGGAVLGLVILLAVIALIGGVVKAITS